MTEQVKKRSLQQKGNSYVLNEELGRGSWGRVFAAIDDSQEDLAIKVLDPSSEALTQAAKQGFDVFRILENEAIALKESRCKRVIPRRVERTAEGEIYIVMPRYESFLDSFLGEDNGRKCLANSGLNLNQVVRFALEVAEGLGEIHTVLKRPYGDLKPDNVAIDSEGGAVIGDLGTSSLGRTVPRKGLIGCELTRPPENWEENAEPTKQGDVWGFGSFLYRLFTGKYALEDELRAHSDDLLGFFKTMNKQQVQKNLRRRIRKNTPIDFWGPLERCLDLDPQERYSDCEEMRYRLGKRLETPLKKIIKDAVSTLIPLGAIAAAGIWMHQKDIRGLNEDFNLREKTKYVKIFQEKRMGQSMLRETDYVAMDTIQAWVNKFKDVKTGVAAYLNPNGVYEAIQRAGGKTDWKSIEPYVGVLNNDLPFMVFDLTQQRMVDNWAVIPNREFYEQTISNQWALAKERYDFWNGIKNMKTPSDSEVHGIVGVGREEIAAMMSNSWKQAADEYRVKRRKEIRREVEQDIRNQFGPGTGYVVDGEVEKRWEEEREKIITGEAALGKELRQQWQQSVSNQWQQAKEKWDTKNKKEEAYRMRTPFPLDLPKDYSLYPSPSDYGKTIDMVWNEAKQVYEKTKKEERKKTKQDIWMGTGSPLGGSLITDQEIDARIKYQWQQAKEKYEQEKFSK